MLLLLHGALSLPAAFKQEMTVEILLGGGVPNPVLTLNATTTAQVCALAAATPSMPPSCRVLTALPPVFNDR